jgi:pimeloyl-ACP methyl ester carboxylesterase
MRTAAVTLILLLLSVSFAQMQETPLNPVAVVRNSEKIALTSETTGREYVLSIALPDSYGDSDEAYPVLYVLDPAMSFLTVTEFARFLGHWEELPELIIVGIGYETEAIDEFFTLREVDYYTDRDNFIQFVTDEVFPLINEQYRTEPEDRGLIGFSYGGEVVYHILVTEPEMFTRYAAIDAEANELMPYLMRDDDAFRQSFADHPIRLFVSLAGENMLGLALETRAYEGLTVTAISLGDVTHAAALHLSLPQAIIAMYAG